MAGKLSVSQSLTKSLTTQPEPRKTQPTRRFAISISTTFETLPFCVEALKEAIAKYGKPEIMNSDQGSQFTGFEWINALKDAYVKISMDGKGRWIDNRMIERLWRSLKYECIYINAFETGSETRAGIGKWMAYYNAERPHSTHGILTPDEAYDKKTEPMRSAA